MIPYDFQTGSKRCLCSSSLLLSCTGAHQLWAEHCRDKAWQSVLSAIESRRKISTTASTIIAVSKLSSAKFANRMKPTMPEKRKFFGVRTIAGRCTDIHSPKFDALVSWFSPTCRYTIDPIYPGPIGRFRHTTIQIGHRLLQSLQQRHFAWSGELLQYSLPK